MYWVGHIATLASIFVIFAALSILYVVRATNPVEWQPVSLPPQLLFSTGLLGGASFTVELARRALRNGELKRYTTWLLRTGAVCLAFVISQLLCWRLLLAQRADGHTNGKFFYLLTGAHALHIIGGLMALGYLIWRVWNPWRSHPGERRSAITAMLAAYWHFMFAIWLALYALLAVYG
jgi:cytochrome c oxidase subunit 3